MVISADTDYKSFFSEAGITLNYKSKSTCTQLYSDILIKHPQEMNYNFHRPDLLQRVVLYCHSSTTVANSLKWVNDKTLLYF